MNADWPVARQEVEVGQWEQKNSEKKKAFSTVLSQPQKKQDVTASPNKVPSHVANIDKNNVLM